MNYKIQQAEMLLRFLKVNYIIQGRKYLIL